MALIITGREKRKSRRREEISANQVNKVIRRIGDWRKLTQLQEEEPWLLQQSHEPMMKIFDEFFCLVYCLESESWIIDSEQSEGGQRRSLYTQDHHCKSAALQVTHTHAECKIESPPSETRPFALLDPDTCTLTVVVSDVRYPTFTRWKE